ncbi:MAG: hypothetical protein ABSG64_11425 [Solirubrobacteraceae bacterium]
MEGRLRGGVRRSSIILVAGLLALGLLAAPASGEVLVAHAIDGPNANIEAVGGVALARDGTGGIVYTELVGGVSHVFVSTLAVGVWSPPTELDPSVTTPDSQPVIAASDGGRLAVVWISGGELFGAVQAGGTTSWTAPQLIAPATDDPAIAMSIHGTAYVAYVAPDAGGSDIDVARLDLYSTTFVPLAGALNASPASDAGGGPDEQPSIAVAADGTGLVAWGETDSGVTNVWVRRVYQLNESSVSNEASLVTFAGATDGAADSPVVSISDDSNVGWVGFRQTFEVGSTAVSRVLVEKLLGDVLQAPVLADSLGVSLPGSGSALAPSLQVNGDGAGLLASELSGTNALAVATLGEPGDPAGSWNAGGLGGGGASSVAPNPVVALSRNGDGLVAFTPTTGVLDGLPYANGKAGPALTLTSPGLGPLQPQDGVAASADGGGATVVGFVQGSPGALAVAVAANVPPPSHPWMNYTEAELRTSKPTLTWGASAESWMPITYQVLIDGKLVGTTPVAKFAVMKALKRGIHTWQVIAIDGLGQKTKSSVLILRIKVSPSGKLTPG